MTAHPAPTSEASGPVGAALLAALERIGPRPALVWHGEAARIELSGHVLASWIIKSVGHLVDELDVSSGELLVLDLAPHWKRLVLALAGFSLGMDVRLAKSARPGTPADPVRVLATDRTDAGAATVSPLLDEADEVLVLEAASMSLRWMEELPPLAHDWVQEVRAAPDALAVPLGPWSGPAPALSSSEGPIVLAGDGLGSEGDAAPDGASSDAASSDAAASDAASFGALAQALGAWLDGCAVLMPAQSIDEGTRRAEGA